MNETSNDSQNNIHESLRRKFSAWTLAVVSSLSTTASVGLNRQVWADDPPQSTTEPTKENADALKVELKSDAATSNEDAAKDANEVKPKAEDVTAFRSYIQKLIQSGKAEQAMTELDAAIADRPNDGNLMYLEYSTAALLSRECPDLALKRFGSFIERSIATANVPAANKMALQSAATYSSQQLSRRGKVIEALDILDRVLQKGRSAEFSVAQIQSLVTAKLRVRVEANQADVARDEAMAELNRLHEEAQTGNGDALSAFCGLVSAFNTVLGEQYPEASAKVLEQANGLVRKRLDADDAGYAEFAAFNSLKSGTVSRLVYSEPKRASELLDEITLALQGIAAKLEARLGLDSADDALKARMRKDLQELSKSEKTLDALRKRVESSIERAALIGTLAPEFEADAFVGMKSTSLRELKGKVVLIDFWAVWCGPCIMTFPHLIHLSETYGEKGFEILGVTRYEKYAWNETAQKAVKDRDVSKEDEREMLKRFREQHKLHHGFVVLPEGSDYFRQFKVSGIPQVALVDQEGAIQLIQVGATEASSKLIESKIQQLLGVDSPQR